MIETRFLKMKKVIQPYLFIGPGIVFLVLILLVPIGKIIIDSFYDNRFILPTSSFIGLENYKQVITRNIFNQMTQNSFIFMVFSVISHLLIGMGFALLLNQSLNKTVLMIFRGIFILPWIFTAAVVALVWNLILSPLGIFNYILGLLSNSNVTVEWLGNPRLAMFALIMINAWRGYPFIMVSILAGLQSIDKELYEAASIDGANSIKKFLHITLPQLRPILLSIGLLDSVWTFNLFPLIWLTTGGGPGGATETVATFTYKLAFNEFQFGQASAMAVIVILITLIGTMFYLKYQKAD